VSWLTEMDEHRRQLMEKHPGWLVWYVPRHGQRVTTWCARQEPLLNADSPEALSAAIEQVEQARADQ
jgi:hypothetical protein